MKATREKMYAYEMIHRYIHEESYRKTHKLEHVTDFGAKHNCKYKEYIKIYPKDRDHKWEEDI